MEAPRQRAAWQLMAFTGTVLTALVAWYYWHGWDLVADEHPHGRAGGLHKAWQVIGLVVTLLGPVVWAVTQRCSGAAAAGTTLGLTAAAYHDWSNTSNNIFWLGVGVVMIGAAALTTITAVIVSALTRGLGRDAGLRRRR